MPRRLLIAAASGDGPRRLNHFAGRALGEAEFALMQGYVADRVTQLLTGHPPGILWGLSVTQDGAGDALRVSVQPGLALGADGRGIRLHQPLVVDWPAVVEAHKTRTAPPGAPDTPLTGWYLLTLRRSVAIIDPITDAPPCTRTELDILRDSRIETLATLDLQLVSAAADVLALDTLRAVNRLGASFMSTAPFDADTGAVPIAFVKLANDLVEMDDDGPVIDATAGRLLAVENAAHLALRLRWAEAVERLGRGGRPGRPLPSEPTGSAAFAPRAFTSRSGETRLKPLAQMLEASLRFDPALRLSQQIGVDFLPAAGPLPEGLLTRIAGRPLGEGWALPEINFDPLDLQIEMAPIRSSQVEEALEREMARGVVDLVHTQNDRIRVLVAVPDQRFRPDLMDLPETDAILDAGVYTRAQAARAAWQSWADLYDQLFGDLDETALNPDGTVTDEARALFRAIRIPAPPLGIFPTLDALGGEAALAARSALGVGRPVSAPASGSAFFSGLIATRATRATAEGTPLPRPYAGGPPTPPDDLAPDPITALPAREGLYRRRADLQAEIALLEEELDANDRLIADFDVFIRAQRQQVDSITVSFTALAGGVPGDGSGLQLARWTPFTTIAAAAADPG
ncbi:MAG: hypothetical protein AAGI50_12250 [Pseudomonadota bacterium]